MNNDGERRVFFEVIVVINDDENKGKGEKLVVLQIPLLHRKRDKCEAFSP